MALGFFLPAGVIFEAFLFQFKPADQRNGDGEAKCPACRARVCPTVLHPSEPGSWLPAQVNAQNMTQ